MFPGFYKHTKKTFKLLTRELMIDKTALNGRKSLNEKRKDETFLKFVFIADCADIIIDGRDEL
jgi:hypothetical protein